MAKSSKSLTDAAPDDTAANGEQSSGSATTSAGSAAKKSAKTTRKRTSTQARKTEPGARPKKAAVKKKAKPAEFTIPDEDIRLRAYFIAQHRALSGLNGDSASDWLEARRQLFEEASRRA